MTSVMTGDILIVRRDVSDEPCFLIVDAITKSKLCGPFPSLREALQRAAHLGWEGAIWHNVDERGREFGPPIRLPIRLGLGGK